MRWPCSAVQQDDLLTFLCSVSPAQVSFGFVAVCVAESCWRITRSSTCPMWSTSWAASMSSPRRWCPVSLWTRPLASPRSSGMRYECRELDTAYSLHLCTAKTPPADLHHPQSRLSVRNNEGRAVFPQSLTFSSLSFLLFCFARFVNKSWSCAWESSLSSDTCRLIQTGPTSSLILKLTRSGCPYRLSSTRFIYFPRFTLEFRFFFSCLQVALLDFGATRGFDKSFTDSYIEVRSGRSRNWNKLHLACY